MWSFTAPWTRQTKIPSPLSATATVESDAVAPGLDRLIGAPNVAIAGTAVTAPATTTVTTTPNARTALIDAATLHPGQDQLKSSGRT